MGNQQLKNLFIAAHHQCAVATFVPDIDVGLVLQKKLDHPDIPAPCGNHQGRIASPGGIVLRASTDIPLFRKALISPVAVPSMSASNKVFGTKVKMALTFCL
jgi:hypothetical protein